MATESQDACRWMDVWTMCLMLLLFFFFAVIRRTRTLSFFLSSSRTPKLFVFVVAG